MRLARRATALRPTNVVGLLWSAIVFSSAGLFDEATEWIDRARLLDPLSPYAGALSAMTCLLQFRDDAALRSAESVLASNPDYPLALYFAAGAYVRCGRAGEAVRSMERAVEVVGRLPFYLGWLGWVYAAAGRVDEARAVRDELLRRAGAEYVHWVPRAWVHGALAETDAAFTCFERAAVELEPLLGMVHLPPFDPVRDDPRFAGLLEQLGCRRGPR